MSKPLTATAMAKLKSAAKKRAAADGISHSQSLELEARLAGYSNWHAAVKARTTGGPAPSELEIDPVLPPDFDNTPNEERSQEELERWWKRPFAITRPDGGFTVRCLDGGAWDRSTWYGDAETLEGARTLARDKLARWQEFEDTPIFTMDTAEDGQPLFLMTIAPTTPGYPRPVVEILHSQEEALAWLEKWKQLKPEEASAEIRRAREQADFGLPDQAELNKRYAMPWPS